MGRDADRLRPAGRRAAEERESVRPDTEYRDIVRAGIDGEEQPPVIAQRDRALRAETGTRARAARPEAAGRRERAVAGAREHGHRVAGHLIGDGVDGTRDVVAFALRDPLKRTLWLRDAIAIRLACREGRGCQRQCCELLDHDVNLPRKK